MPHCCIFSQRVIYVLSTGWLLFLQRFLRRLFFFSFVALRKTFVCLARFAFKGGRHRTAPIRCSLQSLDKSSFFKGIVLVHKTDSNFPHCRSCRSSPEQIGHMLPMVKSQHSRSEARGHGQKSAGQKRILTCILRLSTLTKDGAPDRD